MKSLFMLILISLFLAAFSSNAALPFTDDFESGNTSAWSSSVPRPILNTYGGAPCTATVGVTMDAALTGLFGFQTEICDSSGYLQDNSPSNETSYRAIFDFNPNTANIPSGFGEVIFQANSDLPVAKAFELSLFNNAGTLEIRAYGYSDAGTTSSFISIALPDFNTHTIGVGFKTATADGNNDGELVLELDQIPAATSFINLDNDTLAISNVRLGFVGSLAQQGVIYYDNFYSDVNSLPVTLTHFEIE
jgi:hypothetical protein